MKRLALVALLAVLAVILVSGALSAQPGPGYGGGRPGYGNGCPGYGGGGPGMQRGQGGWYCPWRGQQTGTPVAKPGQPLTADQAKALVEQDIAGNPNLKAGQVSEREGAYEVEVLTQNGSLADKVQVNKQTGWLRSASSK
jgi:hypothetical protein